MAGFVRRPVARAKVIAAARSWLGTPYHDQQSVRDVGCDCLGLARGIWRDVVGDEPFLVPAYSRDWGEMGNREVLALGARECLIEIPVTEIVPGAALMFRMRNRAIAKHVGIMVTSTSMVHARENLGVIEEELTEPWRRRIAFAFLFPQPKRGH